MDNPIPTLEEFLACCDREYGFLVRDYGFERLREPREYNEFSVRFARAALEVHVYGENWGQSASCDLVRGDDHVSLGWLMPRVEGPRRARRKHRPDQLAQIRALAGMLQEHAQDFLNGDTRRFDAAVAEWKRITRPRPVTEAHRLERERQTALAEAGHARRHGDYGAVIRLLEPHAAALSAHQRQMLDEARRRAGPASRVTRGPADT